jgi:hypothetical protein
MAMTTPAEYREFAIDCMRVAEQAQNAGLRDAMMGLARVWFRTAIIMEEHAPLAGDDPARSKDLRDGLD